MIDTGSWRNLTPSVPRRRLLLLAGLLWSLAGASLIFTACFWLAELDWPISTVGGFVGLGGGFCIYRLGFSRIAVKNIRRIDLQPNQVCLFAFQAWRSYLLIALMMLLGYTLRQSHLPRLVLAIIYSAIGTGLSLSSLLYYERLS